MKKDYASDWQKYTGFFGFIKYISRYFMFGILISPIVLHFIHPEIWTQMQSGDFYQWIEPVAFLVLSFSVLPFLLIGILLWKHKNREYLLRTKHEDKYKQVEAREWRGNDKAWHRWIEMGASVGIIIAIFLLGLGLGHNAPNYYSYPFIASCVFVAFCLIYTVAFSIYSSNDNGVLLVPRLVKYSFILLIFVIALTILNMSVGIQL